MEGIFILQGSLIHTQSPPGQLGSRKPFFGPNAVELCSDGGDLHPSTVGRGNFQKGGKE